MSSIAYPAINRWAIIGCPSGTKGLIRHPARLARVLLRPPFNRPSGTRWDVIHRLPSDKSLGYYRMSLRDERFDSLPSNSRTLRVGAPEGQLKIAQHFSAGTSYDL